MNEALIHNAFHLIIGAEGDRDMIAKGLKGSDWQWIHAQPLREVAARLLGLCWDQPGLMSGTTAAQLAKRLMAAEVAVGGPYADLSGDVDVVANAFIGQLFSLLGSPLPQVVKYVDGHFSPLPSADQAMISAISQAIVQRQNAKPEAVSSPIAAIVEREIAALPDTLHTSALAVCYLVTKADHRHEITRLSDYFQSGLSLALKKVAAELGVANFYTWMAYTVYDDFLDEEGTPALLPVANVAHRASVRRYQSVLRRNKLDPALIDAYFDRMDAANAWEATNCRFSVEDGMITIDTIPAYKDRRILAERAIAHIIGPLVIARMGNVMSTIEMNRLEEGLSHYLIARQLNDDLHDWMEDLGRGHITAVVAALLRGCNIRSGTYPLSEVQERLKEHFWRSGLETLSGIALQHIARARGSLTATGMLPKESDFITNILDPIERSARAGLERHHEQKQFLIAYTV